MSGLSLRPIPGAERLLELHAAELPQKNELCGAFWGTLALRLAGVTNGADPVDQDAVGALAGSVLAESADEELPPGETGRADYRITFRSSPTRPGRAPRPAALSGRSVSSPAMRWRSSPSPARGSRAPSPRCSTPPPPATSRAPSSAT